jgi:hypothetical protein
MTYLLSQAITAVLALLSLWEQFWFNAGIAQALSFHETFFLNLQRFN